MGVTVVGRGMGLLGRTDHREGEAAVDHTLGATDIDPMTDRSVRRRRMEALQQAHRARAVLDRGAELVAQRERDGDATTDATARSAAFEADVARLEEIHRNLLHERHVARRMLHRRSERLVLALELAERLALDRLGFVDYADFEAHRDDAERVIIDVDAIEQAARDLAEAEAVLEELDGTGAAGADRRRAFGWTVDPVLRRGAPVRATTARRQLFGDPAIGPDEGPSSTDAVVIADWPLPFRPRVGGRPVAPADPLPHRRTADEQRVLGEIVRHGRRVRVERIGSLLDDSEADDPERRITYGDPERPT